ncbi:hypothetical protein COCSADRAFT_215240 [Bipolaris sorokiniana ND90Pr]|uniref:Uncharacterized protein n=1 Tax=Cochliobolus sativus (strain ND90Pr / ATCC 201652) TaxID=665912 RepID=M2TMH4_COCSN|nr:uncharacterized protein COCSADRAFT_215240 [Bipolaris sorokiniana ND90Pr]EMD69922.1 hypothetical protein COCSADRAFT_215240 [Bipolaris sorokiniana ND90Pr]
MYAYQLRTARQIQTRPEAHQMPPTHLCMYDGMIQSTYACRRCDLENSSIFLFLLQLLAPTALVFERLVLKWSRLQRVASPFQVHSETSNSTV